jgi:serine/threonine protein kinase
MSELRTLIKERYYILEEIGRGGLTTVFKAFDFQERCDIALKILAPHLVRDPTFKVRFEREIKILKEFDHPHIVPILDSGEHQSVPFLVMPYFPEGTLTDRLRSSPLTPDECGQLINEISLALDYEHKRGIVHRDIKPSNILLDKDGKAYLSDFDLVYLPEASQHLTGSAVIGTPAYMSPEQCSGGPVDSRSDQYSLAIVLYQLTTGHLPFYAETPIALAIQQINEPLPRPRELNPKLPESMQVVLEKALSKDPDQRFPSILSFNHAVQRALRIAKLTDKEERSWTARYYEITQGFDRITSNAKVWISESRFSIRYALLAGLLLFIVLPLVAANLLNSGNRSAEEALKATIAAIYTDYAPREGTVQPEGYVETVVAGTVSAFSIDGTALARPIFMTGEGNTQDANAESDEEIERHVTMAAENATQRALTLTPQPTMPLTPTPTRTFTKTWTPSPTQSPKSTPTIAKTPTPKFQVTETAEANQICDDRGKPLSYFDMHNHPVYYRDNGLGFVVHALSLERQETEVKLVQIRILQDRRNPEVIPVEYFEWAHWGIGSSRIFVGLEQREVILKTDLDFFDCYNQGKCDHSLYGGDIYVHFDGELNGTYELELEIYLPEYGETCNLSDSIEETP